MIIKIAKSGLGPLAETGGPWRLTFALVGLENRIFSYKSRAWHLDFTGLGRCVSFNFPLSQPWIWEGKCQKSALWKSKVSLIIILGKFYYFSFLFLITAPGDFYQVNYVWHSLNLSLLHIWAKKVVLNMQNTTRRILS